MPKLSGYLLVMLAALSLSMAGCGDRPRHDANSSNIGRQVPLNQTIETKRQRVLGLFGGYLSCGSDQQAPLEGTRMVRYMNLISAKLAGSDAAPPEHVISCFGLDATRVNYVSSQSPAQVNQLPVEQFIQEFVAMVNRTEQPDVHVVGHSYGGWLGLQIATAIKDTDPPRSLTTIDPISHQLCTPPDVVNSMLGNPSKPTCLQAPADLSEDDLVAIGERTQTWLNFYQTDANLLHSGVLAGAENIKRSFPSGPIDPHTKIADDGEVVNRVLESIGAK